MAQSAYLALRAFNLETARIADTTSTPAIASLRLQFWRDTISSTLAGRPPAHPGSLLLSHALNDLHVRTSPTTVFSKSWFLRIISAREQYIQNNPYPTLDALEKYAESTYSTLMYLTLQALPLNSVTADHLASHIGKAAGIVAVLRGLPLLAFPGPANHHSNAAGLGIAEHQQRGGHTKQRVVTLPLDIMAENGVREEDVLRLGADAPGLKDAVFAVATRASDHLITARAMLQNLSKGGDVGHAFEHEGEDGHQYGHFEGARTTVQQQEEVERGFGILISAVSTSLWLERLQKVDFDIFKRELRQREWRLPWKAFWAYRQRTF